MKTFFKSNLFTALLLSFTLGLAPFTQEPHLFGKIRWIVGGCIGMKGMDLFDLFLHGAPWIWFTYCLSTDLFRFEKKQ
tara:strand:- start:58 stop:291 length:234 start_codon:yes stop_codon:yes gene_type:complete